MSAATVERTACGVCGEDKVKPHEGTTCSRCRKVRSRARQAVQEPIACTTLADVYREIVKIREQRRRLGRRGSVAYESGVSELEARESDAWQEWRANTAAKRARATRLNDFRGRISSSVAMVPATAEQKRDRARLGRERAGMTTVDA